MKPGWDSYFIKIAYAVSERSTCDRAFVGCVLVQEKGILTTGFNGSPAGQPHCDEAGHLMVDGHACARSTPKQMPLFKPPSTEFQRRAQPAMSHTCLASTTPKR